MCQCCLVTPDSLWGLSWLSFCLLWGFFTSCWASNACVHPECNREVRGRMRQEEQSGKEGRKKGGLRESNYLVPDPVIHRDSQQGAVSGHEAFLQPPTPIDMITGGCWGPQQVRSPFWLREWRNPSDRMWDTISVCFLANHDFCWQFHEGSFLQHSQRNCQLTISHLQGIYLSLSVSWISLWEMRNDPCHLHCLTWDGC